MTETEKKCRKIAKEKQLLIRNNKINIVVYYTVTITRQYSLFKTWEEVLNFVENYK
jgi:hypothetical protein